MSGADFSLTTFSPSGKLVQIEYALNAVNAGKTSLGIKGQYNTHTKVANEESVMIHKMLIFDLWLISPCCATLLLLVLPLLCLFSCEWCRDCV